MQSSFFVLFFLFSALPQYIWRKDGTRYFSSFPNSKFILNGSRRGGIFGELIPSHAKLAKIPAERPINRDKKCFQEVKMYGSHQLYA